MSLETSVCHLSNIYFHWKKNGPFFTDFGKLCMWNLHMQTESAPETGKHRDVGKTGHCRVALGEEHNVRTTKQTGRLEI